MQTSAPECRVQPELELDFSVLTVLQKINSTVDRQKGETSSRSTVALDYGNQSRVPEGDLDRDLYLCWQPSEVPTTTT